MYIISRIIAIISMIIAIISMIIAIISRIIAIISRIIAVISRIIAIIRRISAIMSRIIAIISMIIASSSSSSSYASKHGLHRNFAPRHPYLPVKAVDCGGALATALRGGGLAMLLGNPAENALSDVRKALGRQRAFLLHFLETRPAP